MTLLHSYFSRLLRRPPPSSPPARRRGLLAELYNIGHGAVYVVTGERRRRIEV